MSNSHLRIRLVHRVTVDPQNGTNVVGDELYSTGSRKTYTARVEKKLHEVVNQSGKTVVARGIVYLGLTTTGGLPNMDLHDRITLPDNSTPPVLSLDTNYGRSTAVDHQAVHFG